MCCAFVLMSLCSVICCRNIFSITSLLSYLKQSNSGVFRWLKHNSSNPNTTEIRFSRVWWKSKDFPLFFMFLSLCILLAHFTNQSIASCFCRILLSLASSILGYFQRFTVASSFDSVSSMFFGALPSNAVCHYSTQFPLPVSIYSDVRNM